MVPRVRSGYFGGGRAGPKGSTLTRRAELRVARTLLVAGKGLFFVLVIRFATPRLLKYSIGGSYAPPWTGS